MPRFVDVLSIDIDGADYEVWRALAVVRARLVVLEYNSAIDPRLAIVPRDPSAAWDGTQNFGSSLGAMVEVANEKNYDLIYLESCGVNAFLTGRSIGRAQKMKRLRAARQIISWREAIIRALIRRSPSSLDCRRREGNRRPGQDATCGAFCRSAMRDSSPNSTARCSTSTPSNARASAVSRAVANLA